MNNIIQTIRHTARAAAVLLIALCAAQTAWAWRGQGTEANPYQIASAAELQQLATDVNSGTTYDGMYFKQTAAIDMNGKAMSPIGDASATHRFGGHYDGDNKSISHLAITGTTEYTALFGYVSGTYNDHGSKQPTSLKNIVLTDCNINGSSVSGGYAAGICANATLYTTVENCRVSGTIKGNYGAGGIVGLEEHGNVKNCFADVTVTASVRSGYSHQAGTNVSYCIVGKIIGYVVTFGSSTVTGNYYRNDGATDATGAAITAIGQTPSSTYADADRATPVYPDSGTSGLTISDGKPIVSLNGTNYSTQGDTYTIYDAAGWNIFCDFLNDNETHDRFSGKTVRLGADITVSRMAGSSGHDFCGTFDGKQHTLTFNYGTAGSYASDDYAAPFHYVSNVGSTAAAFRDLHVAGDIYTSAKYAAGLIAQHWGTVNVENCRVSTVIHSSVSGDGTHGGIEAVNIGVLNITGCVFDGKLLTTTTNGTFNCGGFVGWHNGGTTNISNSLYAPAAIAASETEVGPGTAGQNPSATFGRNAVNSIANSYYTRTLGTAQGKQARSIIAGDGVTLVHAGVATVYSVSGITAYKTGNTFTSGILYNNVLYAGSGDAVSLTSTSSVDAPDGYQYSYTASAGTLSGSANPYTLTMPDADVTVTATVIVTPWDGDGSKGKPYLIKYASQLDLLAHRVNGTHGETLQSDGYKDKYFQLDNDISYTHTSAWNASASDESNFEAIGGYYDGNDHYFRGHFDGNSKTISGIRIYKGGDPFQGIFGRTDGADIHDITLADARITGYYYTGGIVGYNNGGTVTRCHVAADVAVCAVQSYAWWHGGIVGYNDGGTIEQCTSAATLTLTDASNSAYYGGIAGQNYRGTLHDNLAIGATVPATADNTYGAITGRNVGTLQRNYYAACKVADTENATGVGCGYIDDGNTTADITTDDGAMPGYFLTLGEGVTSSALSITIPAHKELNGNGQLVTVAAVTYNVAAEGTTIGFNSGETEGYSASYSVNGSPVSGNSITMPAAPVTVTSNGGESIDLWGMAGGANGSSDHPYTITTTEGWNLLAGNVAAGKSYSGKYFQLGAGNISISTMVGTSACHFSGHFNGNGNTLAVNMTSAGEYTAPFRYVGGATITGLHTTGTVTTAHKYATGLVGRHDGNVTISNCRSSVAIVSSVSGDGTHGGFVATGSGTATIEGCLFDGVICTTASGLTNSCGGFVGWNSGTVNISNSLYAPASVPEGKHAIGTAGCATFARNGVNSIANSYYTQTIGNAQGKACHSVTAGGGVTIDAIALTGDATEYTVSGITAYSGGGLQRDENLYYGSGDVVSLTLANSATPTADAPAGYQYGDYSATGGATLSGSMLTMADADVTVSFTPGDQLRSTHQAVPVSYIDADGQPASHNAIALDETMNTLGQYGEETWYFVGADISYSDEIDCYGIVNIILADGYTMTVNSGSNGIYGSNGTLTIYGQTLGTGTLNATGTNYGIFHYSGSVVICGGTVNATATNGIGIYTDGIVTINGGTVNATGNNNYGIVAYGDVTITGGQVTATGENGAGIFTYGGNITLGCTNASDFIKATSYCPGFDKSVNIASGQTLYDEDGHFYSGNGVNIPAGKTLRPYDCRLALSDDADNTAAIAAANGKVYNVTLQGRTLYKDGDWNTLCLPFALGDDQAESGHELDGTPLEGATLMTLGNSQACNTGFDAQTGTLNLEFLPATTVEPGVPYIVKWPIPDGMTADEFAAAYAANPDDYDLKNPVFTGVTVTNDAPADHATTSTDGYVTFVGTYGPAAIYADPAVNLYLGAANKLYWPTAAKDINSFRAYFQLNNGLTCGDPSNPNAARAITLNFGDDEATGIVSAEANSSLFTLHSSLSEWFTLDGRRLDGQPTQRGIYINNGKKVVIK